MSKNKKSKKPRNKAYYDIRVSGGKVLINSHIKEKHLIKSSISLKDFKNSSKYYSYVGKEGTGVYLDKRVLDRVAHNSKESKVREFNKSNRQHKNFNYDHSIFLFFVSNYPRSQKVIHKFSNYRKFVNSEGVRVDNARFKAFFNLTDANNYLERLKLNHPERYKIKHCNNHLVNFNPRDYDNIKSDIGPSKLTHSYGILNNYSLLYQKVKNKPLENDHIVIYADGSYNNITNEGSFGLVIITSNGLEMIAKKHEIKPYIEKMSFGSELASVEMAIKIATARGYRKLTVFNDLNTLTRLTEDDYVDKNPASKRFRKTFEYFQDKIEIDIIHVKGHSSIPGNVMADRLAFFAINDLEHYKTRWKYK